VQFKMCITSMSVTFLKIVTSIISKFKKINLNEINVFY